MIEAEAKVKAEVEGKVKAEVEGKGKAEVEGKGKLSNKTLRRLPTTIRHPPAAISSLPITRQPTPNTYKAEVWQ